MKQSREGILKKRIVKSIFIKTVMVILILITTYTIMHSIYTHILFPKKYENIVNNASKLYNVDPYLIFAIIKQESKFNEKAISKSNAKGLMQLLDSTASEIVKGINTIDNTDYNLFDAYTNINIGTKYFSNLLLKYEGNIYISLAAYNAGMGNISTWFDLENKTYNTIEDILLDIQFNETKTYVKNIIKYYNIYKTIYN